MFEHDTRFLAISNYFNVHRKRTVHNCAVILQDVLQERLASSVDEQYKLPENVLDDHNIYVTRVDEPLLIMFQFFEDVLGDSSDIKNFLLLSIRVELCEEKATQSFRSNKWS